jgi:dihydrofolate reductase
MDEAPELVSVAAVAGNGVIGDDDDVPWHLPEDVRRYRTYVADAPVIVGRRTFEMMRSDPPGRARVVLSRTERRYDDPDTYHAGGVEEAVERAASLGADVAYVLGGAAIYELFQPHVDRMRLSRVDGRYEGDARYPDWDPADWRLVDRTPYEGFAVEEWIRLDGDADTVGGTDDER